MRWVTTGQDTGCTISIPRDDSVCVSSKWLAHLCSPYNSRALLRTAFREICLLVSAISPPSRMELGNGDSASGRHVLGSIQQTTIEGLQLKREYRQKAASQNTIRFLSILAVLTRCPTQRSLPSKVSTGMGMANLPFSHATSRQHLQVIAPLRRTKLRRKKETFESRPIFKVAIPQ
jgi:hypothetical protein